MPCFCIFSLILIAIAGGALYCGSQGNWGPYCFFLSVFIWIGELSKGFLVNKVDLLNSDSSFLGEPRNDLLRGKYRKTWG